MRRVLAMSAMLLLSAVAFPSPSAAADTNSLHLQATYNVDATFHWADRQVTVHSAANVKNTTSSGVDQLAFNLATLRIGHAHVGVVLVDGHAVNAQIDDQTVLVPLAAALSPGGTRTVSIDYTATLATSTSGGTFNVNADTFAGAIAGALKAKRLLLLTDVPGVLDKDKNLITDLSVADARRLIADGTISGGMIPKVETCIYALDQGVEGVVIMDGKIPHAVLLELLTDHGVGTLMHR